MTTNTSTDASTAREERTITVTHIITLDNDARRVNLADVNLTAEKSGQTVRTVLETRDHPYTISGIETLVEYGYVLYQLQLLRTSSLTRAGRALHRGAPRCLSQSLDPSGGGSRV